MLRFERCDESAGVGSHGSRSVSGGMFAEPFPDRVSPRSRPGELSSSLILPLPLPLREPHAPLPGARGRGPSVRRARGRQLGDSFQKGQCGGPTGSHPCFCETASRSSRDSRWYTLARSALTCATSSSRVASVWTHPGGCGTAARSSACFPTRWRAVSFPSAADRESNQRAPRFALGRPRRSGHRRGASRSP